jgi:hypothetical protein
VVCPLSRPSGATPGTMTHLARNWEVGTPRCPLTSTESHQRGTGAVSWAVARRKLVVFSLPLYSAGADGVFYLDKQEVIQRRLSIISLGRRSRLKQCARTAPVRSASFQWAPRSQGTSLELCPRTWALTVPLPDGRILH